MKINHKDIKMNIVSFLFCILTIYFAGKIGELMILYWKGKAIMRIEKEHSERSNKLFEDPVKRKEAGEQERALLFLLKRF